MPKGQFKKLTRKDEEFIKAHYLDMPIKAIAKHVGISWARVMRYLDRNGLDLPKEVINKNKNRGRYKKGESPFNKGLKIEEFMSPEAIEKSKKGRFKKGNSPYNLKHNGAIVTRKDTGTGRVYKYIRLSKMNWQLYHRVVWEKVNGPIPEDYVLNFKDGDSLNCKIENLKLISKTEHMFRNSKHDFPEELIPSLVLSKQLENKLKTLQDG